MVALPWVATMATAVLFQTRLDLALPIWPTATVLGAAIPIFFFIARYQVTRWLPNQTADGGAVTAAASPHIAAHTGSPMRRLLWLQRKQDAWLCFGFAVVAIVCCVASVGTFEWFPTVLLVFLSGMLGVLVFRGDQQEKRFRLLAQLGVPVLSYWFSKLLIPSLAAFVDFLLRRGNVGQRESVRGVWHWFFKFLRFPVPRMLYHFRHRAVVLACFLEHHHRDRCHAGCSKFRVALVDGGDALPRTSVVICSSRDPFADPCQLSAHPRAGFGRPGVGNNGWYQAR